MFKIFEELYSDKEHPKKKLINLDHIVYAIPYDENSVVLVTTIGSFRVKGVLEDFVQKKRLEKITKIY